MTPISLTTFRRNLARYFDQVTETGEPLVVTRQAGNGNVVVMAEADFRGWQATVHLLSSPKNAERLIESLRQIRAGSSPEQELVRPTR
jgi:antitoxin YefM